MTPTHRRDDMTPIPTPSEALRVGIDLINGDLTGAEWKRACRDFVKQATAALAAAPQPAPTHECPVCEETVTWTRPGSPYCGECAADNGRDVRMRSIGTAPQPTPVDREALVEVIEKARERSTSSYAIADALLARGLRLPGGEETMAWAAKVILSQPKQPDSPVADAFTVACAYLEDRECGAETTNEIIETFLKALAGEDN